MALLTCSDVTFSYEGIPVLTDVNFALEAGSYLCIVGENGSGKSTLVKGLLHLKNPSTGSITTGDGLHPSEIGYLPQQTQVQKDFPASVREIVLPGCQGRCGSRSFYNKEEKKLAAEAMEKMQITRLARRCYRELSGGQQQRVAIARAIAAQPPVILADEPTGNLDSASSKEILAILKKMHKTGRTVILITHDNGIAAQARRVVRIMDGKIESDTINPDFDQEEA